jgi:hypothetical protein
LAPSYPLPAVEANRLIGLKKLDLAKIRKVFSATPVPAAKNGSRPATSGSSGARRYYHGIDCVPRIAVNS